MLLENDVDTICPDTYFVKDADFFGRRSTVELKPGGAGLLLTNGNKREYAALAAAHALTDAIREPILAFQQGLWEVRACASLQLCASCLVVYMRLCCFADLFVPAGPLQVRLRHVRGSVAAGLQSRRQRCFTELCSVAGLLVCHYCNT